MTAASDFFDMSAAPMRVGKVRLKVRDLDAVSSFYRTVLGLTVMANDDCGATLGTGHTSLLVLEADPTLAPRNRRQAGLFHTAFLMPTRVDLARWLSHAVEARVPLQGVSDHIVSEAIYLADPEDNGIEVYADRPVARWRGANGDIKMSTAPLDKQNLLAAGEGAGWTGFPKDGSIGHVHLQIGDTAAADRFYRDVLGFDTTVDYPGASFYGSGGYHHQLAGNIWNSRGATQRPKNMAGLDNVEIIVRDPADIAKIVTRAKGAGLEATNGVEGTVLRDPFGTAITLRS